MNETTRLRCFPLRPVSRVRKRSVRKKSIARQQRTMKAMQALDAVSQKAVERT